MSGAGRRASAARSPACCSRRRPSPRPASPRTCGPPGPAPGAGWPRVARRTLRFGVPAAAAALVVPYDVLGVPAGLLAAGWIVLVAHGFVALDHADGVMGTAGVVMAFALGVCAVADVRDGLAALLCVLAAALTGFLMHNAAPARVTAGRGGALFTGFVPAAVAVLVLAGRGPGVGGERAGGPGRGAAGERAAALGAGAAGNGSHPPGRCRGGGRAVRRGGRPRRAGVPGVGSAARGVGRGGGRRRCGRGLWPGAPEGAPPGRRGGPRNAGRPGGRRGVRHVHAGSRAAAGGGRAARTAGPERWAEARGPSGAVPSRAPPRGDRPLRPTPA
ncbi:hypothetical protein AB7952_13075 [Streptomyces sp. PG2]